MGGHDLDTLGQGKNRLYYRVGEERFLDESAETDFDLKPRGEGEGGVINVNPEMNCPQFGN